jgi:glucosamine--fructose-6-phosphate aminotransferase (isomerizing)
MAIAQLSAALAQCQAMWDELEAAPEVTRQTLSMDGAIAGMVQRYRYMHECVVIGRGYNYATAFELALKLKELTYTVVEPYSSADFMHGPLAVLEHGFPVIVIAPSGAMKAELKRFIETLDQRRAEVIVISDDGDMLANAQVPLELPRAVPEWLSPITAILPGQLFAMRLAAVRSYDPDKPRAIKKVTETK